MHGYWCYCVLLHKYFPGFMKFKQCHACVEFAHYFILSNHLILDEGSSTLYNTPSKTVAEDSQSHVMKFNLLKFCSLNLHLASPQ